MENRIVEEKSVAVTLLSPQIPDELPEIKSVSAVKMATNFLTHGTVILYLWVQNSQPSIVI